MASLRRGWIPFAFSFAVIALLTKTTPESAHEYSRLGTVESLVERGTYRLDDSIFVDTLDKIYRDGHYYSHQTPLLAMLSTPIYAALRIPGLRFNNRGRLVLTYLFSLFTNGVALALTVLVFWRLLALVGTAPPWREVLAVLLPFGTWLLPYGIVANNHGVSALLLALAAYALLLIEWHGITRNRIVVLGAALGLCAAIELLPLVSFVPLTVVYLLRTVGMTAARWRVFSLLVAAPLIVQAAINIGITGDVIPGGFHHELFNYPGAPFTDVTLSGSMKHESAGEFLLYLWMALFGGNGYFTFAPVLLIGVVAGVIEWRWWAHARGAHFVLLVGALISLLASLLTTNHFGGGAVGFRHATYLAPVWLVMLLPWAADRGTKQRSKFAAVVAIAALSTASMTLFAACNPWSPLTLASAAPGALQEYVPLLAKIAGGTLLTP